MAEASRERLAPEFHILVGGSELPPAHATDILSVCVDQDVDVPSMFRLELLNWDSNHNRMTWSDSAEFDIGSEIEVRIGYRDRVTSVMQGEVTAIELEIQANAPPRMIARGYDRSHRLARGVRTTTYTNVKDSELAVRIASQAGLSADVEATTLVLDYVLQRNQSDLAFLKERAARIGYEVLVEGRELHFRSRRITEAPVATLATERDLMHFNPRVNSIAQVGKVSVRGWNPADKREIVGSALAADVAGMGTQNGAALVEERFGSSEGMVFTRPVFTQEEADDIAKARLREMALSYITGDGTCIGRSDLRAGKVVTLEGLGHRFSGDYYLTSVKHVYRPSIGYRTHFAVRRNAA